jgi:membrane fusion protein (multidrug efflux system)
VQETIKKQDVDPARREAGRQFGLALCGLRFWRFCTLVLMSNLAPAWAQAPEDRILVQAWAETETALASPMVGLLQMIPTRLGHRFSKGDDLLRFECTENEARSAIAQAELTGASENLEAKIRLKSMDAASDIEVTTAAAQVAKAEAQLKLSRHQVEQCVIKAPFDGYVVRLMGKPFQTATVGQPLLEIVSAGVPKLRVSADSKFFTRIRVGTNLRVTIKETGLTYQASVVGINARIDSVNQTFEMEARVQGPGNGLLPGMSGTAVLAAAPVNPVPTATSGVTPAVTPAVTRPSPTARAR